jgi:hypothetical protein
MTDDPADMITVMNGRDTLGFLLPSRSGGWRAFDDEGRPIGEFPNREAARAAIVHAAFNSGRPAS